MLNRRALLAVPLALGNGRRRAGAERGEGRADRADVGTLGAPGRPDAEGREPRDRAHQRARRHQGAERRQDEAAHLRCRRQRREGEERRAAHGGAGARPRRRDRRVALELHARRHRGDRARRTAGAHPLLFGPDHGARLQVRVPDLARRRRAGGQRDAGDPQARRGGDRQEGRDRRHHPGQHRGLGQLHQADARRRAGASSASSWWWTRPSRRRCRTARR